MTNRRRVARLAILGGGLLLALTACTPAGPRALLRGERRLIQRDYPAALADLKEAVARLPGNAQAWNHLGLAYHYTGQSAQALEAYQHALVLDRNLASACFNAGCLDLDTANYAGAVDYLTTFTSLQPRSIDGWLRLGSAQTHLAGQSAGPEKLLLLESARRSYEFVNRLHPSAEALNGLGLVSVYRSRTREALGYFEGALQAQANYPPALLNLAVISDRNNDRRVALARYRQYLASTPHPADSAAVEALARQLEQELAPPPPKPAASSNAVPVPPTNGVLIPPPQPAPPPLTNRVAKTAVASNPPPSGVHPEIKPLSPSHQTEVPPVGKPLPIAPKPVESVAAARPAPSANAFPTNAPMRPPPVVTTSPTNIIPHNPSLVVESPPILESPLTASPSSPPGEKRGFFSRLNPVSWFAKKQPALPSEVKGNSEVLVAANTPGTASNSVPPAPKASIPRYHFLHPARGTAGNRAQASKSFDQAMLEHKALHYPEAIRLYEKATNLDPSFFEAYFNLGLAAYEQNEMPVSLTASEHALALNPEFTDLRYNFSLALLKGGYALDALAQFEQLLAASSNDARLHLSMANIYAQKLSDPARAREHYLKVLDLQPYHSQAPAIRAWLAANAE